MLGLAPSGANPTIRLAGEPALFHIINSVTLVGFVGADPEQRIVERWDETDKRNLIETLEACLFLTESKCNVPTQLRAEFGEKQMTLGQYLVFKNRQ
jgi:hypothetical protein